MWKPGKLRSNPRLPLISLLLAAPFFGEFLSTATAPLDLLLPWSLMLMVGMYGCGAVLCREAARRWGLGFWGLVLLAAAYAVYEEGLVDRFWYDPDYWDETGVDRYSVVGHTSVLTATHLTIFHVAVSVIGSIVFVERLFPERRSDSWIGPIGMVVCALSLGAVMFIFWEEFYVPPIRVLVFAAALSVLLVIAAWLRRGKAPEADAPGKSGGRIGLIAFVCTTMHFISVYAVPATRVPWPIGVAITLVPVAVGVHLIRKRASGGLKGPDALRVITGIVAFFLLLNFAFGFAGRLDMTVAAVGFGWVLWKLQRAARNDENLGPAGV